ncbi:MAG: ABC transporter ATP-binding protein [Clostridiales bacterium]|nr:ABC transporter ATP-binding protein [Candidatus Coliplasma equi]
MLKSVCLKKQILYSLANPDNILYFSNKNLLDFFKADGDVIYLFEPDGTPAASISYGSDGVSESDPADIKITLDEIRKIDGCLIADGNTVFPLRHENTSVYGAVTIKNALYDPSGKSAADLVALLGSVLYREAMGAIITSFFPKVLQVRGLEMTYGQNNRVLKGIDLDICENEFTVILGSSGCGKTTMMNAVGGMLTPTKGEVLWNGKIGVEMKVLELYDYRRDAIGLVFQQYNLINDLTARENVEVAASFVKSPMSPIEALSYVGLEDKAAEYPGKMSGGQQQRVCIARAISKRSRILLCDEPTGALDPENSIKVMCLLQKLVKEEGIAVVMITHNTAFSVLADHYVLMSDGKVIEDTRQPFPMSAEELKLR